MLLGLAVLWCMYAVSRMGILPLSDAREGSSMQAGIPHNCDGVAVVFPAYLASNMVLQRFPARSRLWGSITPRGCGEFAVNITIRGKHPASALAAVTTPVSGVRWEALLPPLMPASSLVIDVTVVLLSDVSIAVGAAQLTNIAVGDVFICAGQSNMRMALPFSFGYEDAMRDAATRTNIRVFTVALAASQVEWEDLQSAAPYQWGVASQKGVLSGPARNSYFSTVCYFYGRKLQDQLRARGDDIPIGLISSSWQGAAIQPWSPPAVFEECHPHFAPSSMDDSLPVENSVMWNTGTQ